jgi:flagellin-like hook-associated protein FlgL
MRVTQNMTSNNAIYNINKNQNRLNQLNDLLSSNQNINRPSDDPIGTRQVLDLQSQVRSIDQYMSNIQTGQTWTSVANTALQGMNDMLTQAKSATSKILASMDDPGSVVQALATLDNVRQQMIDMANIQVANQYVFGGFNNANPAVSNKQLSGVIDVSKTPNQIAGIDTTGLLVGMTVAGKGILPETTITKIDSVNKIVTLSKNPISSGSGFNYTFGLPPTTQKGSVSLSSSQNQITGISTVGLNIGDPVTGKGVQLGTTITSIDNAGQITLSLPLTQAVTGGSFNFVPRTFLPGDAIAGALNTITTLPSTVGLSKGAAVSGPGVPSGTTIASIDSLTQITLSQPLAQPVTGGTFAFTPTLIQQGNVDAVTGLNIVTGLAGTGNFTVGDKVTGPGVPTGTTIFSKDSASQVTLSNPLTSAVSGGVFTFTPNSPTIPSVTTQSGNTSFSSSQVTGLDTTNLSVGMSISGPGIPPNTTITKVDSASQITLSQPLTQAVTGGDFTFLPTLSKAINNATTSTTINTNTLTGLTDTTGLAVGMSVSGPNIPVNTKITGISGTTLTLDNNATLTAAGGSFTFGPTITKAGTTNPPNQITGLPLAQVQNLYVGMKVTGPGIPANTTITDIDTTDNNGTGSITLSKVPTGPGGAGQFVFEGYIDSYGDRTVMGTVAAGSAVVSGIPSTANMVSLPIISKSGSTNPTVNPNQITGMADTNGLNVGMPITDNAGSTIIPPNTIITNIDPVTKTITLSNTPLSSATGVSFNFSQPIAKTCTAGSGANTITGIADTNNLFVGMPISDNAGGTIIPPNTTVTTISAGPAPFTVVISNNTTAAAPAGTKLFFTPTMPKTGATDPVANPNKITGISTTNLFVGMPVTGSGIPANTTITGTDTATNTVTLSNNPTTTAAAGTFYFGQYSSMSVSGTGVIPTNPTIGSIANSTTINLSAAANVTSPTGGSQLTFSGYFADEEIKVNINKSSQVSLNYSAAKLLLGGAPPAATQASGPPPSTLPVNILGTIGELMTAIQNKDQAAVIAAASNFKTATDQIFEAQTEYAGRTIRLDSAQTMQTNNQMTLKGIINNKQTLDTAKTIILLQQQTTAYQAALQGTAKILPISIMDYLR